MDQSRLRAIPLFSSLSDAEARKLATFATETSVPKDQVLIKQGDYASDLIAIEEGTAGLLSRSLRTASVIATSPMRIIKLTHWDVARMSDDTVDRIKEIIAQRQEAGVADPAAPPS
jgi:CRP-like cAMP-binding protein